MGIKQHAHVVNTMAPTPLWECYGIETYEMWERRKGLGIVANFLGWSSCLFEGFPKINLLCGKMWN